MGLLSPLLGVFLLYGLSVFSFTVAAQEQNSAPATATTDTAYAAQRAFALNLFKQNHHLEALPVLAALAKQNPSDAQVLGAWGVCLVDHAATLEDEQAANQDRIQARKLLLHAKELGNNSVVVLNLLEMLPEDGKIRHDSNGEVEQAMHDGEAAFARNDYDDAIVGYSKVFALDPKNYSAVLFIGDCYFAKKESANATLWYERAIQIDPDLDTAYRYEADMLTKNGDMEKARTRAIQAVVAAPYNGVTWRALQAWAKSNGVALTRVRIKAVGGASQNNDLQINIPIDPSKSSSSMMVWIVYSGTRALWRNTEFKKNHPSEAQYRHSLGEEAAALQSAANVISTGDKKKSKEFKADPDLAFLQKLSDAKMIEPYVLLSAPDQGIAADYAAYRDQHREQLERYLSQFIVPPVPAKK